MTDLHDEEMTGTISTARHQVVRYRAWHESGDLFEEGQDFDGLTLTIEVADAADAQAMLDAISSRAAPADDLRAENELLREAIVAACKGLGAPGEYGYSSREGKAVLALHQARVALWQPEPPRQTAGDMRGALKAHITAVIEGIRHLSVDDAADLLAEIADDLSEDRSEDLINGAILDGIRWGYTAAVTVEMGGGAMLRAILPGGCGWTHQWGDGAVAQPQIKAALECLYHPRVSASNAGDE